MLAQKEKSDSFTIWVLCHPLGT